MKAKYIPLVLFYLGMAWGGWCLGGFFAEVFGGDAIRAIPMFWGFLASWSASLLAHRLHELVAGVARTR